MINRLTFLFLLLFITSSFSQQVTYFVKYKNSISHTEILNKVSSQRILSGFEKSVPSAEKYRVKRFAHNLAPGDDNLSRILKINFTSQQQADYIIQQLSNDSSVDYIQRAGTYHVETIPDDSLISEQWALTKIGAFEAWDITSGSPNVLLAVIDTGIEFFHPDLKNKIYYNPGEQGSDLSGRSKNSNGVDDDNNGFIDDYMGWDFTDRIGFPEDSLADYHEWDNYPYDPIPGLNGYHGTFVAGIAAAEANNKSGIAGVAPGIKILNLRCFDKDGNGEEDDVAAAILYAVNMNAKVINMSFGDSKFSYVLRDVIRYAYSRNIVMVASSGNNDSDEPHYPSGYSEVISVGNSNEDDFISGSYGSTLDLVAPGANIISTGLNGTYRTASGTSASAPHVSAAAALVLSLQNFHNEEIKQILKSSSDDVGQSGWDTRSGAGRLNLNKTLRILSPANIRFNHPFQDFATMDDTLNINVNALSPYFLSLDLTYGSGLNPTEWTPLVANVKNQVFNEDIFIFDLNNLIDGDYTLRLTIKLNNGSTTEERVNFHIQREAPEIELVGAGPVYYGSSTTIMGEIYTNMLCSARMYYRQKGTTNFDFISLDGFATNNQFIKQLHYGFIPKQIVKPNTSYDIYFEAENLAGLKTMLMDSGNKYFEFATEPFYTQMPSLKLDYQLPRGTLFMNPLSISRTYPGEILFDELDNSPDAVYHLYLLENNVFVKEDSIVNKIPRQADDFNMNGKTDLISSFQRTGYIDEAEPNQDPIFKNKFTLDNILPLAASDLNGDGTNEIISNQDDLTLTLMQLKSDLTVDTTKYILNNYTAIDEIDSSLGDINYIYQSIAIADNDNDGKQELWTADSDGDLLSFEFSGSLGNLENGNSIITRMRINKNNILSAGDFDGDGIDDIAVILNSESIANYFYVMIFNFKNNTKNVIFEKVFLNQAAEFSGSGFNEYYQTLRLADLDYDNKDELILNLYPYAYIIKHTDQGNKIIYYDEGINTQSIFAGDLNMNGITEIAFQSANGFSFYEFAPSVKPPTPTGLTGYSIDASSVLLSWEANAESYYILKGTARNNLELYDSTNNRSYIDTSVEVNENYYYSVKAINNLKEIPVSESSKIIEVYSHAPAAAIKAESFSAQSVQVTFSDRISNTIDNLEVFEIPDEGIPNSVTASSQYSYLLSFNHTLTIGTNKIIINGLSDYYGSPVAADTLFFNVEKKNSEKEFFISSHEILDPYNIKVSFNDNLDAESAIETSNYIFEPANRISSVSFDESDKKVIYIKTDNPVGTIGREYRLRVQSLKSEEGIIISSSAGSYIVLTGYSENLANVYVYPSPVKLNNGSGKMMFANLPQKAKIWIMNIQGNQLSTLEEKDGNGGVEYDLKDQSGNLLNTGIYLYRIVRLDNNNNEVEEKIGKFAVIR